MSQDYQDKHAEASTIKNWMTPKVIGSAFWAFIAIWVISLFLRGAFDTPNQAQSSPIAQSISTPLLSTQIPVSETATHELVQTVTPDTVSQSADLAVTATNSPVVLTETETSISVTEAATITNTPTPIIINTPIEPTIILTPTNIIAAPTQVLYQAQIQNLFCHVAWENFQPNSKIHLKWSWFGRLQGTEYLEIRVGPKGGRLSSIGKVFAEPNGGQWEWWITPQGHFLDGTTKEFQWQVVHMTGNGTSTLSVSDRGCFTVN